MKTKRRIFSFLLMLALLVGILPAGMTGITVSAEELKEIENISGSYDEKKNYTLNFGGVEGAASYSVRLHPVWAGRLNKKWLLDSQTIDVSNESQNSGTFRPVFDRGLFYDIGLDYVENDFGVEIIAYNKYKEEIAVGEWIFESPYLQRLEKASGYGLSGTGIFSFEQVPNAVMYKICAYSVRESGYQECIAAADTPNTFLDISKLVEEGTMYRFSVRAYPKTQYGDYAFSALSTETFTYHKSNELTGTVDVLPDKTVRYGGFLNYLNSFTDTTLLCKWRVFSGGGVKQIDEADIDKYDASLLRVRISAPGVYEGAVESPGNRYTSSLLPYVATDLDELRDLIKNANLSGKTVYIKLGKDISGARNWFGFQNIYGTSFDIDLAGYTLSYTEKGQTANYLSMFKLWDNGVLTIRDSTRYDDSKKKTVTGKIIYQYSGGKGGTSAIFEGHVRLVSGECYNKSGSKHHGYRGLDLKMSGGLIEAGIPFVTSGDISDFKTAIFDGTLSVTGELAFRLGTDFFTNPAHILNCNIVNNSGKSTVNLFRFGLGDEYTEAQAKKLIPGIFYDNSSAFYHLVPLFYPTRHNIASFF